MQQKILILDPSRQTIETLRAALEKQDYEVIAAYTAPEAQRRLQDKVFHLIILGDQIAAEKEQSFPEYLHGRYPGLPAAVLCRDTLAPETRHTLERLGCHPFPKSLGISKLLQKVREICRETGSDEETGGIIHQQPGREDAPLLGESSAMHRLRQTLEAVARTQATVLLRGETGTGKELAARSLHAGSPRNHHRFLAVNCAALTESLLESELFGHEKGAFTGAHRQKLGKFEYAGDGTLFLDEIGEIPPPLQAKLLRVLDDREFERVGGNKTLKVRCRIIAASNINFPRALKEGRFREDLYYRLNVVSIDLPPLRERKEDIPLLARHFLKLKSGLHRRSVPALSPEAEAQLMAYSWPGNVRELENIIEQAVILAPGNRLNPFALPEREGPAPAPSSPISWDPARTTLKAFREEILRQYEGEYFDRLLRLHRGHISHAARAAGIDRKTFYRKIKQCGIDPARHKNPSR
ncbi:MAG: sigma 54-interacting transcriptional regulator [Nitrospinaceae bacterium]